VGRDATSLLVEEEPGEKKIRMSGKVHGPQRTVETDGPGSLVAEKRYGPTVDEGYTYERISSEEKGFKFALRRGRRVSLGGAAPE